MGFDVYVETAEIPVSSLLVPYSVLPPKKILTPSGHCVRWSKVTGASLLHCTRKRKEGEQTRPAYGALLADDGAL